MIHGHPPTAEGLCSSDDDRQSARGLKPDNIMVRLQDEAILHKDAHEFLQPLPQKQYPDRTIYLSRNNYGHPSSVLGLVAIADFGDAVWGHGPHYGCIQAEPYRVPEVILNVGWSYSADIWSLGVMVQWNNIPSEYGPVMKNATVMGSAIR